MTLTFPPHCAQVSISIPKTRLSRWAQKLLLHEGRQAAAVLFQGRQERRVVLVDQIIEKSGFGTMACVPGGWQDRG